MKCKVCNKELFIELDFRTIFKMNYKIHESCKRYLNVSVQSENIPIENNTITLLYFFDYFNNLNHDFLESRLMIKAFEYCLKSTWWSTILWMTLDEYRNLDAMTQYLILKLNDQSIVFLNVFRDM